MVIGSIFWHYELLKKCCIVHARFLAFLNALHAGGVVLVTSWWTRTAFIPYMFPSDVQTHWNRTLPSWIGQPDKPVATLSTFPFYGPFEDLFLNYLHTCWLTVVLFSLLPLGNICRNCVQNTTTTTAFGTHTNNLFVLRFRQKDTIQEQPATSNNVEQNGHGRVRWGSGSLQFFFRQLYFCCLLLLLMFCVATTVAVNE